MFRVSGQWVTQRDAVIMRQRAEHIDQFRKGAMCTQFCWHETMIIQPNRERRDRQTLLRIPCLEPPRKARKKRSRSK